MPALETTHRFRSEQLGNERAVWVRQPPDATTPAALTVFLDAELYRDRVKAPEVVDELQTAATLGNSWFVFVSSFSPEARWIECPCHPPFAAFLHHELLPWLQRSRRELARCERRILAGLSYTGLAAAYAALAPDNRFTHVIAQSGSFWWNDCWLPEHVRRSREFSRVHWYLDVGTRETAENVRHKADVLQVVSQIEGVRRMRDALRGLGSDVRYEEFSGAHDGAAWRAALPMALQWALPRG